MPTTVAATVGPSGKVTCTAVTPLTTCALVTIRPSPSSTKPEPVVTLKSLAGSAWNAAAAGCTEFARTATTPSVARS